MAKTQKTLDLEHDIMVVTRKIGVFGCFEVTIGFGGKERVDFMTYDTQGIFRCYEIKVSKSDFHSKSKNSFVGHYNYYVLTKELYDQIADEIPDWVGCYVGQSCVKKPKKQDIDNRVYTCRKTIKGRSTQVEIPWTDMLKDSFIRSLYRDSEKLILSENQGYLNRLKAENSRLEKARDEYCLQYNHLYMNLVNFLGRDLSGLLGAKGISFLTDGKLKNQEELEEMLTTQQRIYCMDRKQLAVYLHSWQSQEYTVEEIEKILRTRSKNDE